MGGPIDYPASDCETWRCRKSVLASLEPGDSFAGRYEVQRHLGGGHRKVVLSRS